jgi:hypothetical protein
MEHQNHTTMPWTSNKRACKALYFSLQRCEQIPLLTEFDEAGLLTMPNLQFFNIHNSSDLRKQEAIILASRLDSEFTKIYKAKYENGATTATAIAHMVQCMLGEDTTVEALSDCIDNAYKFRDEQ